MSKNKYDFKNIENKWKEFWEKERLFLFDKSNTEKKIFSLDTPPPTVSGRLHMGHALGDAHQDFIARFKRLKGFNVLNPFGTDNNGLPTLKLVEKEKKVDSKKMKREDFIELCNQTINKEFIPMFLEDMKNLGVSADFSLFYSTIDENSRKISQESFIDLYEMGREYRIDSPALWCPNCQTTISQVELEDKEFESYFNDIVFKVDNKDLIIATTRPELLPACVCIFVHPNDKRYKSLIGKKARVPLFDFEVPILKDKSVDMEKGTGIVMCCTFGDQQDMEWQKEHNLEIKKAINYNGKMTSIAGRYEGMSIENARKEIINDLKEKGLIKNQEKINHIVNVCERCKNPIEIMSHKQWFIKYLDLKEQMLKWGSEVKWYPKHMKTRYDNWIKGLKWDWCISRQIPFGIPFPVWYCSKCEEVILANKKDLPVDPLEDKPGIDKCPKCNNKEFIPEKDIINTWATSSLTPVIVKSLLKGTRVYEKIKNKPLSLRRNGQDIITFWDFNTIVKSELHNKIIPWNELYINGWMLGRDGKKMSKSLGNGVSPLDVINEHGADILRYLCSGIGPADAVSFSDKELVAGRKLITKLNNASRFVFMNLSDFKLKKPKNIIKLDELFMNKLVYVVKNVEKYYEEYNFPRARQEIEQFFWNDFCDNYLEIVKKRIYQGEGDEKLSAQYVLYNSLLSILKMISPIMPFIAEEIYQEYFRKTEKNKSIHISEWPEFKEKSNKSKLKKLEDFYNILSLIRQEKSKAQKPMNSEIKLELNKKDFDNLNDLLDDLKNVVNSKDIKQGTQFKVEFI